MRPIRLRSPSGISVSQTSKQHSRRAPRRLSDDAGRDTCRDEARQAGRAVTRWQGAVAAVWTAIVLYAAWAGCGNADGCYTGPYAESGCAPGTGDCSPEPEGPVNCICYACCAASILDDAGTSSKDSCERCRGCADRYGCCRGPSCLELSKCVNHCYLILNSVSDPGPCFQKCKQMFPNEGDLACEEIACADVCSGA